ncbi:hypothetical protein E2C01_000083 [Portunus trituberculatus]|uniref:Uncharacterized protein n=1 Tax=Portunus trituberculatus TaxID=210409 RepID=A0A5B7CD62_PORTR|nr:hypothetical protein [Portunus trituberculatus]
MMKCRFFHTTSSTLLPMVGDVCTTSFISSWYRMVVLPALSRPTITILCSVEIGLLRKMFCRDGTVNPFSTMTCFHASETHVDIEIVKTVAINLLTSIDPS